MRQTVLVSILLLALQAWVGSAQEMPPCHDATQGPWLVCEGGADLARGLGSDNPQLRHIEVVYPKLTGAGFSAVNDQVAAWMKQEMTVSGYEYVSDSERAMYPRLGQPGNSVGITVVVTPTIVADCLVALLVERTSEGGAHPDAYVSTWLFDPRRVADPRLYIGDLLSGPEAVAAFTRAVREAAYLDVEPTDDANLVPDRVIAEFTSSPIFLRGGVEFSYFDRLAGTYRARLPYASIGSLMAPEFRECIEESEYAAESVP